MWGATGYLHAITDCRENFNPRSPCGERPQLLDISRCTATISIHAPRVGSDAADGRMSPGSVISIHAPRVGSDQDYRIFAAEYIISIHAPRVGSDIIQTAPVKGLSEEFQSTLPVWGATIGKIHKTGGSAISIHAPRVGSDKRHAGIVRLYRYFNPRSPCGERQSEPTISESWLFISIHAPRVGSDEAIARSGSRYGISIHAPRVGSDVVFVGKIRLAAQFQSTLPVWGATQKPGEAGQQTQISIHAPRVGSDSKDAQIFLLHLRQKGYFL